MTARHEPAKIQVPGIRPRAATIAAGKVFVVAIFPASWTAGRVVPPCMLHRIGLN